LKNITAPLDLNDSYDCGGHTQVLGFEDAKGELFTLVLSSDPTASDYRSIYFNGGDLMPREEEELLVPMLLEALKEPELIENSKTMINEFLEVIASKSPL